MSATPPTKALLSVQNISRSYGAQPVLNGISMTIHEGDRIGLIGRNGSGKSTLMRILAGMDQPDDGLVSRAQGLRVSILQQDCPLPRERTIGDTLRDAARERQAILEQYHEVMGKLGNAAAGTPEHARLEQEAHELHHHVDVRDAWDVTHELRKVATALDLRAMDRTLDSLSGGELRRVDLAYRLIEHPDLLLLDEPTNHIDTQSAAWIENFLAKYSGSCVLVTHDRYFLDRAVNRIVELEFNRIYSFPGSYSRFLEKKAEVEASNARAEENRVSFLRRELDWIKRGPKARATKQQARIDRFNAAVDQGPPAKHREFLFEIPEPEHLGKTILEAKRVTHGFEGRTLINDFSFIFTKGMRVGIVGPNGSGKTTLLRVLMGQEQPRRGQIIIGDTVRFLYVDQAHGDINPDQTIIDYVSDGAQHVEVAKRRIHVPSYLQKFLFDKSTVLNPIGNLSGGERNRLIMVKRLLQGGNFLVLDEPTNDLDLYTLRVLEETIDVFDGCALIVSHDRYFLNRVCTHLWAFEDNGHIVQIAGGYDDYLLFCERRDADRKEQARAAAASVPKPLQITAAVPRARKLSYKEKQELEAMEATILEAEGEVEAIEAEIHAPNFYERAHTEVQARLNALEDAKKRVEALYARWQELTELA